MLRSTFIAGCSGIVSVACIVLAGFGWSPRPSSPTQAGNKEMIARGKYLVTVEGCNDCHSPKIFTPMGPVIDSSKMLSGHPGGAKLPIIPPGVLGPTAWGILVTNDVTAWAGPWGVSFSRNLTPDKKTGIGSWTPEMFIKALRTGKDMGEGRPILPPMPWMMSRQMTDDDLRAVFAYLQSLPPVENAVPDPLPPPGAK